MGWREGGRVGVGFNHPPPPTLVGLVWWSIPQTPPGSLYKLWGVRVLSLTDGNVDNFPQLPAQVEK